MEVGEGEVSWMFRPGECGDWRISWYAISIYGRYGHSGVRKLVYNMDRPAILKGDLVGIAIPGPPSPKS